jgi:hypothetical protein
MGVLVLGISLCSLLQLGEASADSDPSCLSSCRRDCGSECVGAGKPECVQGCAADNAECEQACELPDPDPNPNPQPPAPEEECRIDDDTECFLWFCWGECTETCCHTSGDQVLCSESPC